MANNPFTIEALPRGGIFARWVGRAPREAAFVEIRNLLATTAWHDVSPADVALLLAKYKLLPADAERELTDIYDIAARHVASDGTASDVEKAGLARLQEAFEFSNARVKAVFNDAARSLYRETLVEALSDGHVTDRERQKLDRIAADLGLAKEDGDRLYREEATKALQLYFDHVLSDRRFSPDEEQRLNQIAEALGITIKHDASTTQLLERFRWLGRIDAGELPQVTAPILLQRGEVCHVAIESITQKELRTVTKRVNYRGVTASIKIVKGVRYRVGSLSPQRITQDVMTMVDEGAFFITSKRVLIQGHRKKTSIPLTKVIHFTVYSDGLQIQKDSGRDVYVTGTGDWEIAGACLDAVARLVR